MIATVTVIVTTKTATTTTKSKTSTKTQRAQILTPTTSVTNISITRCLLVVRPDQQLANAGVRKTSLRARLPK